MDLLTVVYKDELQLLEHQAYSIAYYYGNQIQNIYVILNDDILTHDDIDLSWYGYLQDKVRVFHRSEFGYYPQPHLNGWYTQQVCKILGTALAESKWCMILDAKTLFIRPMKIDELFDQYNFEWETDPASYTDIGTVLLNSTLWSNVPYKIYVSNGKTNTTVMTMYDVAQ